MTAKPVWSHPIEEAAWREKWCRTCFQVDEATKRVHGTGDGCPLLLAAQNGRLPAQWKRRRNAVYGDTYRCADYLPRPKTQRRRTTPAETLPLFEDVSARYVPLVPVDGWPDYRSEARKQTDGDHQ